MEEETPKEEAHMAEEGQMEEDTPNTNQQRQAVTGAIQLGTWCPILKPTLWRRPINIPDQNIDTEPDIDIEPITQEYKPPNEEIIDMDLEAELQKIKERSTNKTTDKTTVITLTRLSRQAKIRSHEAALKKTQKIGQKTD